MARPRKQGLDYFPLDIDFFEDDKVVIISGEFGAKGEMVIIRLLCLIYANGYFIQWSETTKMRFLRELGGMPVQSLDMIINRAVRIGFFSKDLFDSKGVLTSAGIQRRYFEASKYRKLEPGELPYLLVAPDNYSIKQVAASGPAAGESVPPEAKPPQPISKSGSGRKKKYQAREEFLKRFFDAGNTVTINNVCAELGITPLVFSELAKAVVNEWILAAKCHKDYSDAASNLISHVRCKAMYEKPGSKADPKPDQQAMERLRRNSTSPAEPQSAEPAVKFEDWAIRHGYDPNDGADVIAARKAQAETELLDSLLGSR